MQKEQPEKEIRSPHPTAIIAGYGNMSKVCTIFLLFVLGPYRVLVLG